MSIINPILSIVVACLLLLVTSAAVADTLRCEISLKQQCQESTGCNAVRGMVFNLLDLSASTYSRCDSLGCDTYVAITTQSGSFLNIDVPGRGLLAKLNLESLTFLEVATLTDVVYVSWGLCRENAGGQ